MTSRDDQFRRFMGEGSPDPKPTFCVLVDDAVVGWIDYDRDEREWLTHDEVNIGYALHPGWRGRGLATRAVKLMLHHLADATDVTTATLAINADNEWSLGVARRAGFGDPVSPIGDGWLFERPVPPRTSPAPTTSITQAKTSA